MKSDVNTPIQVLKRRVEMFVHERDWEGYHNPKDLAMSICIEAGELLQLFQWLSKEESLEWL